MYLCPQCDTYVNLSFGQNIIYFCCFCLIDNTVITILFHFICIIKKSCHIPVYS